MRPIFDADTVAPGQEKDFEIYGRTVTVTRTDDELRVVSEEHHAVVVRPLGDSLFTVTGARAHDNPSEPLDFARAMRLALKRVHEEARSFPLGGP